MKLRIRLLILLLLLPSLCLAEQMRWTDSNGNSIENRDNKKNINGFGGWLLITSDQNWKEKWESVENDFPLFTTVKQIGLGDTITILTLYTNPQVDSSNRISLSCDIKITRPDGTSSFDETNMECANEELIGPSGNVRLTYVVIDFIAELSDPYGTWTIEVVLKDLNSHIEIPLKNSFKLVNRSTFTRSFVRPPELPSERGEPDPRYGFRSSSSLTALSRVCMEKGFWTYSPPPRT